MEIAALIAIGRDRQGFAAFLENKSLCAHVVAMERDSHAVRQEGAKHGGKGRVRLVARRTHTETLPLKYPAGIGMPAELPNGKSGYQVKRRVRLNSN